MNDEDYIAIPLNENGKYKDFTRTWSRKSSGKFGVILLLGIFALVVCLGTGFEMGRQWSGVKLQVVQNQDGKLPAQSFFPDIPTKKVVFNFPTNFEDTGAVGDKLWNDLMPVGSGFLRLPFPRMYDIPPSKTLVGDHQLAEIYSVSMTHQLHCLGVLRHVIIKYESGSRSRFAGDGHEYHCLEYLRQAILCAGDTTLDHAEIVIGPDGSDQGSGFTGANSTHQCRDWDAIKAFLIKNRASNKTGILV